MPVYCVQNKRHVRATITEELAHDGRGNTYTIRNQGAPMVYEVGAVITDLRPEELDAFPDRFVLVTDDATIRAAEEAAAKAHAAAAEQDAAVAQAKAEAAEKARAEIAEQAQAAQAAPRASVPPSATPVPEVTPSRRGGARPTEET